jgi:hypothetical protein
MKVIIGLKQKQQIMKESPTNGIKAKPTSPTNHEEPIKRLRNQDRLHRNGRGYGPFQRENSESRPTGAIKL